MQIPILSGVFTDQDGNFRVEYPKNLTPVAQDTGISKGYLRPSPGIVEFGEGPGVDRGGINWEGKYCRVMGNKLVQIDEAGVFVDIGDVGSGGEVTLDYSFDYLGVSSNGNLFLYDGVTLQQVTDPDLGLVLDHIWVDGYFMTTDGEFIVVTELNDPFAVNPLKFAASEIDPDPVLAILKLNNEPYVLNRFTIEVFNNVGGTGFPFQRIKGAQINRGTVGTHACCIFLESLAFVGGGRDEGIGVWVARSGSTVKISTKEIDILLKGCSELNLQRIRVESQVDEGHELILIHLPNQTLVYDGLLSQVIKQAVWTTRGSSKFGNSRYRAKNFVRIFDKWLAGDPTTVKHGELVSDQSNHYGEVVEWSFGTLMAYNKSKGMVFNVLELICLTGRAQLSVNPTVWTQYSLDGITYSVEKPRQAGKQGDTEKRIVWFHNGTMKKMRTQRFRGHSDAHLTIAALHAETVLLSV